MIKLGWRDELTGEDAVDLALRALYEAADEDSATGGPDLVRGIFPVVATITEAGFDRVPDEDLRLRYISLLERIAADRGEPRS